MTQFLHLQQHYTVSVGTRKELGSPLFNESEIIYLVGFYTNTVIRSRLYYPYINFFLKKWLIDFIALKPYLFFNLAGVLFKTHPSKVLFQVTLEPFRQPEQLWGQAVWEERILRGYAVSRNAFLRINVGLVNKLRNCMVQRLLGS